jgi:hypothetical protein
LPKQAGHLGAYLTPKRWPLPGALFDRMMEWPPLVAKLHQAQRENSDRL